MEGRVMHTKQLAERLGTSERFIAHQVRQAAKAKKLKIEHVPGQGRRNYVDIGLFREWLEDRGYVEAASRLSD